MKAKHMTPLRAQNVTTCAQVDPWFDLAAAVVLRAVDDVGKRNICLDGYKNKRELAEQLAVGARHWLQSGADGLLAVFDIDVQAVENSLNGAHIVKPGRRRRQREHGSHP